MNKIIVSIYGDISVECGDNTSVSVGREGNNTIITFLPVKQEKSVSMPIYDIGPGTRMVRMTGYSGQKIEAIKLVRKCGYSSDAAVSRVDENGRSYSDFSLGEIKEIVEKAKPFPVPPIRWNEFVSECERFGFTFTVD